MLVGRPDRHCCEVGRGLVAALAVCLLLSACSGPTEDSSASCCGFDTVVPTTGTTDSQPTDDSGLAEPDDPRVKVLVTAAAAPAIGWVCEGGDENARLCLGIGDDESLVILGTDPGLRAAYAVSDDRTACFQSAAQTLAPGDTLELTLDAGLLPLPGSFDEMTQVCTMP